MASILELSSIGSLSRSSSQSESDTSSSHSETNHSSRHLHRNHPLNFRCVITSILPLSLSAIASQSLFLGLMSVPPLPPSASLQMIRSIAPFLTTDQALQLATVCQGNPAQMRKSLRFVEFMFDSQSHW